MLSATSVALAAVERAGLADLFAKAVDGVRMGRQDGLRLMACPDLTAVGTVANATRERINGDRTHYILNRHVNYTNVCNKGCRFCYFARNPKDGGPTPYLLTSDDVYAALTARPDDRLSEIHMVGGIDPRLPLDYYLDLLRAAKRARPNACVKAFTAVEIDQIARVAGRPVPATLDLLMEAGLGAVPGGGAEVLSDRVHAMLHPNKLTPSQWIDISRQVAGAGLPQYATMLFGHVETPEERVDHLLALRALQDETGHLLALTPLAFHPEGTYLSHLPAPTGIDDLRMAAVSRALLDNVAHIKSFWVMSTVQVSQISLWYGADDIDGTVQEYEITFPEGRLGQTSQSLSRTELEALIVEAGRNPVERDTLYQPVAPSETCHA